MHRKSKLRYGFSNVQLEEALGKYFKNPPPDHEIVCWAKNICAKVSSLANEELAKGNSPLRVRCSARSNIPKRVKQYPTASDAALHSYCEMSDVQTTLLEFPE